VGYHPAFALFTLYISMDVLRERQRERGRERGGAGERGRGGGGAEREGGRQLWVEFSNLRLFIRTLLSHPSLPSAPYTRTEFI